MTAVNESASPVHRWKRAIISTSPNKVGLIYWRRGEYKLLAQYEIGETVMATPPGAIA